MFATNKKSALALGVAACLALCLGCVLAYEGPISDHFDGKRFYFSEPAKARSLSERSHLLRSVDLVEWPAWIDDAPQIPPPANVGIGKLRVTHINHATLLIQIDGVNILTDPIWSERASPFSWVGPKRVRAPGVAFENLPRIDAILISHNHYDHLDIATLERLAARQKSPAIVGLGVGPLLISTGLEPVVELDWWQTYEALPNGVKIVFVPARHGSARGLFDRNKTLWGGFVVLSSAGNVYFAGDTGYGEFFSEIARRFGPFRLAALPVGHYEPRSMMEPVHLSPDDAVRAHRSLQAKQSVGMHFGTFHGVGAHNGEGVDQHVADLNAALVKHETPANQFWLLGFGEGRDVP